MVTRADNPPDKRKICIATITRGRPKMLADLLDSLSVLQGRADWELCFLVVDNDVGGAARAPVETFRQEASDAAVQYRIEPREGIPFARNTAMDCANEWGADYLAFVDDDETVEAGWLLQMMDAISCRQLDLVGGPVRCGALVAAKPPNWWERLVFKGIRRRYHFKERAIRLRARRGAGADIVIVTNNWLLDLSWQRRFGVRFDERLRYSGGSDAAFYRDAKALGIRSGWCETAVVYESVHGSRVKLGYQFHRAQSQSIASFNRNHNKLTGTAGFLAMGSVLLKTGGCVLCLLMLPVLPGYSLVQLCRQSGWIVGRFQALRGRSSSLYLQGDGE
jgi:succinoglycan biosynthesis protein ExoM